MKKVILVGASPLKETSFLKERKDDVFYVACDGGYQNFLKEHQEPDLFVGDFDTLSETVISHPKEMIRLSTIKDDTDTMFAIKHCLSCGYDTFYLYGCLGGKIEHTLANIQTLKYLSNHHAKGYLIDIENNQVIFLLHNEEITFNESSGMLSVFALDEEVKGVNEINLKYELSKATLTNGFPLGVSNELIKGKKAKIKIEEGHLLIVAPLDSISL